MTELATTFRSQLDHLNQQAISPEMIAIPGGRGYRKARKHYYADLIHIGSVDENQQAHSDLLLEFTDSSRKHQIYMGAAGFINFSYISAARPEKAILFDINPYQKTFWDQVIEVLKNAETPQECEPRLQDIGDKMKGTLIAQFGNATAGHLQRYQTSDLREWGSGIRNGTSGLYRLLNNKNLPEMKWLDDPEGYSYLRKLAQNEQLGAITLDIADDEGCDQLAAHLRDNNSGTVDLIYLSNIFYFLTMSRDWTAGLRPGNRFTKGLANLRKLISPDALVVSTKDNDKSPYDFVPVGTSDLEDLVRHKYKGEIPEGYGLDRA